MSNCFSPNLFQNTCCKSANKKIRVENSCSTQTTGCHFKAQGLHCNGFWNDLESFRLIISAGFAGQPAKRPMGAIMAEQTLGSLKNPPTNMKCTLNENIHKKFFDFYCCYKYNIFQR